MPQSIQLSVSGLYTAPSDYQGLPPGALDVANNVESRHKNILESRRGFVGLPGTAELGVHRSRMINFPVLGVDHLLALSSDGDLVYYDGATWVLLNGLSSGFLAPNALAKNRFIRGGQNMYITDRSGVLSLASGSGSLVLTAGVPKGLDLEAETNGDSSGFFTNNVAVTTTASTTSGGALLVGLGDGAGIEIGQYVTGTGIPDGSTVIDIYPPADLIITTGDLAAGSAVLTNVVATGGVVTAGTLVSGNGIPEGAKVVSVAGGGPYSVTLDTPAIRTASAVTITFSEDTQVLLSDNATATATAVTISFYTGAQVAYRAVFGRVETDVNGNTTTRYGAPSQMAIATNLSGSSTNTEVTATLPKNSDNIVTFIQLFRSEQTDSAEIPPLDQMALVKEQTLTPADFASRRITLTDESPDSTKGIPLYTGTDREGILQSNLPPPSCWDMTVYRNFALYANATQPPTLEITVTGVGAPSGVQVGDQITIVTSAATGVYTAASGENLAAHHFQIYAGGTPSQNITDTVNSLIRVINYDESIPVHAILTSTTTDLPGQMTWEGDFPTNDFTATVSAHSLAYDPTFSNLSSEVNNYNNGVFVSKVEEFEAVPGANLYRVGDSSANIIRTIALRDYVIVLKSDGIYKILGNTPTNLSVVPFDLTTKIIGPDTAVQLNSGVWMLSNQGVVSIDDAGVNAKSPPIDNLLNELIGSSIVGLNTTAFGVGYESDRKYILSVGPSDETLFTDTQYVYNYVTDSWTTWDRNLYTAFIHSEEGKLYISRADDEENGVSKERKSGTYRDNSDEDDEAVIETVVSPTEIVLDSVDGLTTGDILYQNTGVLSPIASVDVLTNTVDTQYEADWATGAVTILKAIECTVTFKQVFGDNPAYVRQFSEGLALFKATNFNEATLGFATDFSQGQETVTLEGPLLTGWGLFSWGSGVWGGFGTSSNIRFYVPANKQLGAYILPTLTIAQAWSNWKFQGLSMTWSAVSSEVGR